MPTNPNWFDWIGFFLGGAFGSLIILTIEKLYDIISTSVKIRKKKIQVEKALIEEINTNIMNCQDIDDVITKSSAEFYTFAQFNHSWLDIYINKFINFRDEKDRKAYKSMDKIRKKIRIVQDINDMQRILKATANHPNLFIKNNMKIKAQVEELKMLLKVLKRDD